MMGHASPASPRGTDCLLRHEWLRRTPDRAGLAGHQEAGYRFVELSAGIEGAIRYVPERMGRVEIREALGQLRTLASRRSASPGTRT